MASASTFLSTARLIAGTAEGLDGPRTSCARWPAIDRARAPRCLARQHRRALQWDRSSWSISRREATQSATARTKVQGKFGYMAPEKLRGGPGGSPQRYLSLGCVLWKR